MTRDSAVRTVALCGLTLTFTLGPARIGAMAPARAATVELLGDGSSFAAPFIAYTTKLYSQSNPVRVSYLAHGDGVGITAFVANRVDFAISDTPLTSSELAIANQHNSNVLQLPILLGAVALTYKLPDPRPAAPLQIDGPTLAAIFQGSIRQWNDPAIARLNPGLTLPAIPIVPIHVAASSGATYTLSDFLSTISTAWSRRPGRGKILGWPTGLAVANEGLIQTIQRTIGAIGYADLYDVVNSGLPFMAVRNAAGSFALPTRSAVLSAANQVLGLSVQRFSIVDAPGQRSYPIAGYTWAMVRARHANTAHGAALIRLFQWMATTAQGYATFLNYVPLPPQAAQLATSTLHDVTVGR